MIRENNINEARNLFLNLGEPNETCLGLSKGTPSGRGIGEIQADLLFESISGSEAVRTGLIEDLEDCRIFIGGIDKDKTSDIATNIIRGQLIQYTQCQAELWELPLQSSVPSGFVWDASTQSWEQKYTDMLVVDSKKILLVPKGIISRSDKYAMDQYHQHYVLNFLQSEHLRMNSTLVRHTKSGRSWVAKKDIAHHEAPRTKEYLARFTTRHPEIFQRFKDQIQHAIKPTDNSQIHGEDISTVVDHLLMELKSTPPGTNTASKYHKLMLGILELLFYPHLTTPYLEKGIHDARKRIDIVFSNCAETGFFNRLPMVYEIPSQSVVVECKNYSADVTNPELDQLAGRFSINRGRFGILACRTLDDMETFLSRCHDTHADGRGLIIPIVDEDIVFLLEELKADQVDPASKFLQSRYEAINLI